MTKNHDAPHLPRVPPEAGERHGRIGGELAFVRPGGDDGLLPINHFLLDLEEIQVPGISGAWTAGLKSARSWLDEILDGSGKVTETSIRRLIK